MPDPIRITNIPSRERADVLRRIMKIEHPTWTIEILEQPGGLFTVFGRPPEAPALKPSSVSPASPSSIGHANATLTKVTPLLDLIGRAESGGNYDAHFGKANNTNPRFTSMSIDAVIAWQKAFVSAGSISSAVGKYQIIRRTLKGLKTRLGLSGTEPLNVSRQDNMALTLLKGRGLEALLSGAISKERFIDNIAMEWAGLPNMTGKSHYDGDGINSATVTLTEVKTAVNSITS